MPECPQCCSQNYRKNGRVQGRQRYLCKDCGRQFLEVKAVTESSPPFPREAEPGMSMILLDLENLKLDRAAEKYLQTLASYPLQVKLAFANWGEAAVNKQDIDFYERGYFLVHVPGGKNSADARMMTLGAAIRFHYSQVKEVFVCSSDWLLTNLSNELLSQNLLVWRVRRQGKLLEIQNHQTGKVYAYSLDLSQEVPEAKQLLTQLEKMIDQEQKSITDKIEELYQLEVLVNTRKTLLEKQENLQNNELNSQDKVSKLEKPVNGKVTNLEEKILCAEDLEKAIIDIIEDIKQNSPKQKITPSTISASFKKRFGVTANQVVKNLRVGTNITEFLENSPHLNLNDPKNNKVSATVETCGNQEQVKTTISAYQKIKSSTQLREILFYLAQTFLQNSGEKTIPLTTLGTNFKDYYGVSVSTVLKALKLKVNFTQFLQSCDEFNLKKSGKAYQITLIKSKRGP
jgi:hypothetical protein